MVIFSKYFDNIFLFQKTFIIAGGHDNIFGHKMKQREEKEEVVETRKGKVNMMIVIVIIINFVIINIIIIVISTIFIIIVVIIKVIKFGWFEGVMLRCLLNIWGTMLFLR